MHGFKKFLANKYVIESFNSTAEPDHKYHTKDGHEMHVHIRKNEHGNTAFVYNKSMGGFAKLVHWRAGAKAPTMQEIEQAGHEQPKSKLQEEAEYYTKLFEYSKPKPGEEGWIANPEGKLTSNSAGKISEHAAMVHLHNHIHGEAGTLGSDAHKQDTEHHHNEIKKWAGGASDEEVQNRIDHGKTMAGAIINAAREKHGPDAKIISAGHTDQPGGIPAYTRGHHKDGQENPSDVAVEIAGSHHGHTANSDGTHFEGSSLKSSKSSSNITAKNPQSHLSGLLDHPTKTYSTEAEGKSREMLQGLADHFDMGHLGPSARKKEIDKVRAKEGVKSGSSIEKKANELALPMKKEMASHLHDHINHLTNKVDDDSGHQLVGKMLRDHLLPKTDMPWNKVTTVGKPGQDPKVAVIPGSDETSPLHKVLHNPDTKYYSDHNGGDSVHIGFVHPETGEKHRIATYSSKTKNNALAMASHMWNVKPAAMH